MNMTITIDGRKIGSGEPPYLVAELSANHNGSIDAALQMLVVDDDSPDGTGEIVLDLSRTRPRLHVLVRRGRRGLGSAIVEGFRAASSHGFAVAVNMDADLSHDPDDIPRLLAALEPSGGRPAAVALGSRRVPGGRIVGWPLSRRVTSVVVNWYARWLLRLPVRDSTTGFRAVSLGMFARLPGPFEEGYAVLEEMLLEIDRAGVRGAGVQRQGQGPEPVGVTVAGRALGVEPDLPGREDALLDGVDLGDEFALAGEGHVPALQKNLEVGRPALLRVVGEVLGDDLREVASQVLGEVHADAAAVDRET
jgi:hypothetical protein